MKSSIHQHTALQKHTKHQSGDKRLNTVIIDYKDTRNLTVELSSPSINENSNQLHPSHLHLSGTKKNTQKCLSNTESPGALSKNAGSPHMLYQYQNSIHRNLPSIPTNKNRKPRVLLSVSSTQAFDSRPLIHVASLKFPYNARIPDSHLPLSQRGAQPDIQGQNKGHNNKFTIRVMPNREYNSQIPQEISEKSENVLDGVLIKIKKKLMEFKQRESSILKENLRLKIEIKKLKDIIKGNPNNL